MMNDDLPWKDIGISLSSLDTIKADIFALTDDTETAKKAVLVSDEILTNIVSYSGAKNAGYFCKKENGSLLIGLYDDGAEFDPTTYVSEEKDPFDLDTGGLGLIMTAQTVREWEYRRENGRNILLMQI